MLAHWQLAEVGRPAELDELAELIAHAFRGTVVFTCALADRLNVIGYGTSNKDDVTDWGLLTAMAPPQMSGCRHNILGRDKRPLLFTDPANDWRIKHCPVFATAGGPISYYTTLQIQMPSSAGPDLPIGSVCLLRFGDELPPWTQRETDILSDFSSRVAAELVAHHARSQTRPRALTQHDYLDTFLWDKLIGSNPGSPASNTVLASQPSVAMAAILDQQNKRVCTPGPSRSNAAFADQMRQSGTLVGADLFALLDVRDLRRTPPKMDAVRRRLVRRASRNGQAERASHKAAEALEQHRVSILGAHAADDGDVDEFEVRLAGSILALQEAVASEAGPDAIEAAFGAILPPRARSSVVVPVYDQTGLALVAVASAARAEAFLTSDRAFVAQIATLCHASLTRQRHAVAARDNIAFIAKISHELRTPMHGMTGQLHLMRETCAEFTPGNGWQQAIEPWLAEAERCVAGLRAVVDEALIYARLGEEEDELIEVQAVQAIRADSA